MTPLAIPRIDCYPDTYFSGLYSLADSHDLYYACSHTGYVILAFDCPALWCSCLQTEIALSTMEAKYVALSTACIDLLSLVALIHSLSAATGHDSDLTSNIHCKIHEDNVCAIILSCLEPHL
ncbi:hypothetical protein ACHAW6_000451 [Cyclotella cf. meneghiniana]